jgi:riboflavin kinase / FMN adenylyltransferase
MATKGMRLFRHPLDLPVDARGAVVAIGNFDGVHRGHKAVIEEAGRLAREQNRPWAVMTFEPHPRDLFRPGDPPFRLTPFREKTRHLDALGIDLLFVAHFDEAFAARTAAEFLDQTIVGELGARHVVAGSDFRFGHDRSGDIRVLETLGRPHGIGATAVEPVLDASGEAYSSTRVRQVLRAGDPRAAAELLGRAWEIEGRVDQGVQLGRTLGFPTCNIALADYMRPKFGVYAVRAGVDLGRATVWRDGVANLGSRPTVGGVVERLEVHLFDFDRDVYGHHLRVRMIEFLRPEMKFAGIDALKAQIALDVDAAKAALAK